METYLFQIENIDQIILYFMCEHYLLSPYIRHVINLILHFESQIISKIKVVDSSIRAATKNKTDRFQIAPSSYQKRQQLRVFHS